MEPHLERIRDTYRSRMETLVSALKQHLPTGTEWTTPDGGMFIWIKLPAGYDSHLLFKRAIEKGVAFVPGRAFYDNDRTSSELRLNFTNCSEGLIEEGVKRLGGFEIQEKNS